MKVCDAEVRSTSRYAFRTGEWGRVIGVAIVAPHHLENRGCYVVRYEDGVHDYVVFNDAGNPLEMRAIQPAASP